MYKCRDCSYSTNWSYNSRRHEKFKHKEGGLQEIHINNTLSSTNHNMYDVRLKENFKVFISGPSRCGKTVFVSNLLERINEFAKMPPTRVIYVYKVWQPKYDEMMNYKNNPTNLPSNYTQTDSKPIIHTYANIQPINSTQTDAILHSTKYTNTYKPTHNNTQTDPILHSTKYTNTHNSQHNNYTQTDPCLLYTSPSPRD